MFEKDEYKDKQVIATEKQLHGGDASSIPEKTTEAAPTVETHEVKA